jgi:hypothetical protein
MSTPSSSSSRTDRPHLADTLVPLLAGAVVVVVGVLVAEANHWGTGALWTVGLAGALVAGLGYTIPAARRAPRLRNRSVSSNTGRVDSPRYTTTAPGPHDAVEAQRTGALTLGMPVGPVREDASGLAPDRVLVLSGHASSGKTGIARHLAAEHPDWAWASCGAFVKAEAKSRGLDANLATTNELGQKLVGELGGEGFLSAVLATSEVPPNATTLIVDDVYHVEVFDEIKRRWGHLKFVTVNLSDSMRRELWQEQGRSDEEVAALEENPLDKAVSTLAARHRPEAELAGARTEQEIAARTRDIDELVAA